MRALVLLLLMPMSNFARPPARPKVDAACKVASECGWTYLDEGCCGGCAPTVGSAHWVEQVAKVCAAHPGEHCRPPACGAAMVVVDCVNGQCVRKP